MLKAVAFAACLAALVLIGPSRGSARDEDLFVGPPDWHTVIFGGVDGGRSTFASAGFKHTPTGPIDRTGFVLMETNGYGLNTERFRAGDTVLPATRVTAKAATLAGHQWNLGPVFVTALLGREYLHEQLTVAGRILRLSQGRAGAQGHLELWADPTPFWNVNATVVAGSARGTVWARAATGIRLPAGIIVGPEITTYLTHTYHETRIGLHATALRVWMMRLRVSGGWMKADDGRRGTPYLSVSAWLSL